jgi:hypothetical protein
MIPADQLWRALAVQFVVCFVAGFLARHLALRARARVRVSRCTLRCWFLGHRPEGWGEAPHDWSQCGRCWMYFGTTPPAHVDRWKATFWTT